MTGTSCWALPLGFRVIAGSSRLLPFVSPALSGSSLAARNASRSLPSRLRGEAGRPGLTHLVKRVCRAAAATPERGLRTRNASGGGTGKVTWLLLGPQGGPPEAAEKPGALGMQSWLLHRPGALPGRQTLVRPSLLQSETWA